MRKYSVIPFILALCLIAVFCSVTFGCDMQGDTTDQSTHESPTSPENPVTPASLTEISISTLPAKTIYSLGETLDLTGLKVSGSYSDGSVRDVTVTNAECSGFSSAAYDSSLPLRVTVQNKSAEFTVRVIGNLVGQWGNGTSVEYTLNSDLIGNTIHIRGGTWSVKGDLLKMTYTETSPDNGKTWNATTNDPAICNWDVIVIDGKLRVSEPFYRIGSGTTLVGVWEQIAWHLDCVKVRLTVTEGGESTYSIIPKLSFDKVACAGSWDYDHMYTALTYKAVLPYPACIPGTSTIVTISDSSDLKTAPNGDHPITFFTADKFDIDAAAWVRMTP